jgi:hypothetical protein
LPATTSSVFCICEQFTHAVRSKCYGTKTVQYQR